MKNNLLPTHAEFNIYFIVKEWENSVKILNNSNNWSKLWIYDFSLSFCIICLIIICNVKISLSPKLLGRLWFYLYTSDLQSYRCHSIIYFRTTIIVIDIHRRVEINSSDYTTGLNLNLWRLRIYKIFVNPHLTLEKSQLILYLS